MPTNQLPKFTQDAMKHGKTYEPIARRTYFDHLKYNLQHNISLFFFYHQRSLTARNNISN